MITNCRKGKPDRKAGAQSDGSTVILIITTCTSGEDIWLFDDKDCHTPEECDALTKI